MARLIEDEAGISALVNGLKRVAVLGIKTEGQRGQPAYSVPQYMQRVGVEVVPVPVYYPEVTEILGQPVFRTIAAIPGELDLVDVFRRPQDIDQHVDDIIAKRPKAVWFQLGIRNDEAAKKLVEAGIDVVQDRCLLVEHSKFAAK
ncbi:MAG: CoA-binding protein [Archangium sp.]|nr:CoA-binding protein [Archangium sp.]MDP3155292.1 CoA-binding protein [Archangium sp.]MDP3570953.1 CoA-binding protein [Archangium sp.]